MGNSFTPPFRTTPKWTELRKTFSPAHNNLLFRILANPQPQDLNNPNLSDYEKYLVKQRMEIINTVKKLKFWPPFYTIR